MSYSYSPHGFIMPKHPDHIDGEGCPVIMQLWRDYTAQNPRFNLNDIREQVFAYAIQMFEPFGGVQRYLETCATQADLNKYAHRFLADTMKRIRTGQRDIDILSWPYLLKEAKEYNLPVAKQGSLYKLHGYTLGDGPELNSFHEDTGLVTWVYHHDGFSDMLWTLVILFGHVE